MEFIIILLEAKIVNLLASVKFHQFLAFFRVFNTFDYEENAE